MIKILIIVLSDMSSGELTIGYEFGSRLSHNKYDVRFLIPPKFSAFLDNRNEKYFILEPEKDSVTNKSLFYRYMNDFRPEYFLLSDIYTTEYSRTWSGVYMKLLKKYGIPIIGIDEYEYLSTDLTPDYYGGLLSRFPPLLDYCDYIVRNCPLNAPSHCRQDNIFHFSLYPPNLQRSEDFKDSIRKELGIGDNEKVIFFASSSWESINIHHSYLLSMLMKWVPLMLQHYILELKQDVAVVHVGPEPWDLIDSKFHYIYYNGLMPEKFDNILLSSDLFITINAVSVTMTKAIYGGIPCLLFQNDKHIDFVQLESRLSQMPRWYQKMAHEVKEVFPFKAGFFGWYQLLESVLKDNDYVQTYEAVPMFKRSSVNEAFTQYLFDKNKISNLKFRQASFIKKIQNKVDTPEEIMQRIYLQERQQDGIINSN